MLSLANDILIDLNGYRAYLTDDELYSYGTDSLNPGSYVTTNNSDLGEPSVDKLLNYIDIDYVGSTWSIQVFYDSGYEVTLEIPASVVRREKQIYIPLVNRKPFQKLKLKVINNSEIANLYGLEVDFDIIKRRFHD